MYFDMQKKLNKIKKELNFLPLLKSHLNPLKVVDLKSLFKYVDSTTCARL